MRKTTVSIGVATAALIMILAPVRGFPQAGWEASKGTGGNPKAESKTVDLRLADVEVLDQDGRSLNFRNDVVKDRLTVIDVIYTTCPLVCPILSATFLDLQEALGDRLGKEVFLVSVSVDPNTDIPPRLKEYSQRWDAKPGWFFLTGAKGNVTEVLKGLGAYTADFTEHPTMTLVGDGTSGVWTRFYGFPASGQLLAKIDELAEARNAPKSTVPKRLDETVQRNYFTDTPLLDQDGRQVRFYTDVLKGKAVLISFFYTNCTDICPLLMRNLQDVQDSLGDHLGKDVFFVSISVDPEDDTPEELKKYAERYGAKPGWTFLTGTKENVDRVIYKLGQYAADFEDHSMRFLLGDVRNARWEKLQGDAPPEQVTLKIREILARREGRDELPPAFSK